MSNEVKFNILTKHLVLDNILVEAVDIVANSVIAQPKQYADKPELGRVLNVGPTTKVIKKDHIILFNKYLATKFRISGVDYYVVREDDIVAYGEEG